MFSCFSETADLMILCSDETIATVVSHMYCLPSMRPPPEVHIGSPAELTLHLPEYTITMCAIGLLASDLKEALLKNKWEVSAVADLLKGTQRVAGKKRNTCVKKGYQNMNGSFEKMLEGLLSRLQNAFERNSCLSQEVAVLIKLSLVVYLFFSLFQAMGKCGRSKKWVGDEQDLVEKRRGRPFLSVSTRPHSRSQAYSIALTDWEFETGCSFSEF